jgi:hypothetical protein
MKRGRVSVEKIISIWKEAENAKLKRIVADQVLEITALKDISSKKW